MHNNEKKLQRDKRCQTINKKVLETEKTYIMINAYARNQKVRLAVNLTFIPALVAAVSPTYRPFFILAICKIQFRHKIVKSYICVTVISSLPQHISKNSKKKSENFIFLMNLEIIKEKHIL